ncbi:methyltransferase domain-containing protein [Alkalibacter rhizosphaerae]|uniref:Methyltransferase domain-containing protein n=1 Tax=Alkalibacter rhizosphaerae TaxID=2815577 RepID=A0A975AHT9_9FIRM|nr:methyltransferase domain-containing protein [Alkalibacter rhizosphaerae]
MSEVMSSFNNQNRNTKKQASIALWDSMAQSFLNKKLPTFDEDAFLQLLQAKGMIQKDFSVLDVGCGTGTYSIVLAKYCENVVGVDLSPKMIELARQTAENNDVKNVKFHCLDWHDLDLDEIGFTQKFDLVIAHNTPAIQCDHTFGNLTKASKQWCVFSKPTHRRDPISDNIKKMAGVENKKERSDKMIANAFHALWDQGFLPQFHYEKQRWNLRKTREEAYGLYINRVKTFRELTPLEEQRLRDYIDFMEKDGFVEEDVDTTITTLYWNIRGLDQ